MGGWMAKVIVGASLISCGFLASCFGLFSVGLGVEEWPYVVLAGLAMAVFGIVLCVYGIKGNLKQDKKGSVPKVRSSSEWVCRNCGSQNKQGLDKCIWCGADLK
jgi:peptidoglycan/LPS O-acetylase OafA/YrhL